MDRRGAAGLGLARQGEERGWARHCMARLGRARRGVARPEQGEVRGEARHGGAGRGSAGHGSAGPGEAWIMDRRAWCACGV
jgi:hypothetical protein